MCTKFFFPKKKRDKTTNNSVDTRDKAVTDRRRYQIKTLAYPVPSTQPNLQLWRWNKTKLCILTATTSTWNLRRPRRRSIRRWYNQEFFSLLPSKKRIKWRWWKMAPTNPCFRSCLPHKLRETKSNIVEYDVLLIDIRRYGSIGNRFWRRWSNTWSCRYDLYFLFSMFFLRCHLLFFHQQRDIIVFRLVGLHLVLVFLSVLCCVFFPFPISFFLSA